MTIVITKLSNSYYNLTIQTNQSVSVFVDGEVSVGTFIRIMAETNDITLVCMTRDELLLNVLRDMGIEVL